MREKTRVILVEDDRDLRESLVEYLNLAGHQVEGVGTGLEFYGRLAQHTYDIAVVDLRLPDQDGFVLVEYARKNSEMGLIILTARDAVEDRVNGYGAGADIYLVKPIDGRELAAVITSLAARRRENPAGPLAVSSGVWQLDLGAWLLSAPTGENISLTDKELQLMAQLAECPGRPVGRETLLLALYASQDEAAGRALESLVRRLRGKISDAAGGASPIKTSHAVGYAFAAGLLVK
ncbi:MAG TPA: response regulator transcription factor [Desulfurivibrionaceae bacterium]|nr:response regulator transcription factor [Desulfurivibrionaceae bacterium]